VHLGQPRPRVCCPPGCALANPGAPPLCLWHVHPLAPSGQGVPEGARAVDRRPFPRPVRGARGPQGGRGPGPARARCSIAIGACITPGLHSNTAGSAPDYPRGPLHRPVRPLAPAAHLGSQNPGGRARQCIAMQPARPGYPAVSGGGRPAGPKAPRSKPGAWGCVTLCTGLAPGKAAPGSAAGVNPRP
jgi:hypothetical protein